MKLKLLFGLSLIFVLSIANFSGSVNIDSVSKSSPNILFILTDDLDLAAADYMPQVQSLIKKQGVNFSNYVVNISLCCPSRASILRGQYAHNTGVYTNQRPNGGFFKLFRQGLEKSTIATWLQKKGYRTAFIGKYLNGYPRQAGLDYVPPGWDEWYSPINDSGYVGYNYTLNENGELVSYGRKPQDYSTDVYTAKTQQFITRSIEEQKPFFAFVSYFAPHQPAIAAPRHRHLFTEEQAPRTPAFNEADVTDKPSYISNLPLLDRQQQQEIDQLYQRRLRSLQAVDEGVASLIATLKDHNQLDNTYIVFTSDNGFHLGQHRLPPKKETAYEEAIHLPLYIRGSGIPTGKTIDALVGNIDLAPTFAELAQAKTPSFVDGRSIVSLWQQNNRKHNSWRRIYLLHHRQERQHRFILPSIPSYRGLRTTNCTYVRYNKKEQELYNLQEDPWQLQNLANLVPARLIKTYEKRLKSLSKCRGKSCRQRDLQPLPNCKIDQTVG